MGFAVLLALVAGALWIVFLALQFVALLSLIALGLAIWAVIAMYGRSFLGLYFILGESQIGWAIFGAMLLGTVLLKTSVRHLKRRSR
ncbi:MAG: hypothetical protein IPG93_10105 [Burkholderiales bacterium]|nr:hypothetical protein [Burkholderiales bacterium]